MKPRVHTTVRLTDHHHSEAGTSQVDTLRCCSFATPGYYRTHGYRMRNSSSAFQAAAAAADDDDDDDDHDQAVAVAAAAADSESHPQMESGDRVCIHVGTLHCHCRLY